ncbi:DUF7927 domain-containing protein [Phytoactinopolyspora halotolerans]|uniref:DUF7927 domain-containing protein n=1 Tax=Phytoactinopolyspora halotolerans TaxID=1981512 RepID=A0A6L9SFA7_9ACTN|nr:hypothetical protein [Phytoactinopolyspora halotolerans]NEE03288.1 hypothetical protein [Phytoactinopolyspora halotolerans]
MLIQIPVLAAALASMVVGPCALVGAGRCEPASYRASTTVWPLPGARVAPGDVVRYAITIAPVGQVPVDEATYAEDLSDVLSDARWNGDLDVSSGIAAFNGAVLAWAGNLNADDVATVTYSVTVMSESVVKDV